MKKIEAIIRPEKLHLLRGKLKLKAQLAAWAPQPQSAGTSG